MARRRDRTRMSRRSVEGRYAVYSYGPTPPMNSGHADYSWDMMSDVSESWQYRFDMKPVKHVSLRVGELQLSTPVWYPPLPGYWSIVTHSGRPPWIFDGEAVATAMFPAPLSSALGGWSDEAFQAMYDQIPTEVSLPNFLFELREAKALVPKLEKSMSKTVSGGYLNYQFGWKPMIGDIKKLYNIVQTTSKRLEWLRATHGKKVKIGFMKDVSTSFTSSPDHLESQYGHGTYPWAACAFRPVHQKAVFRAGAFVHHQLKGLDEASAMTKGLLAATGFNKPAGIVWEAIPFSFLVDWIGRVGTLLNRLTVQPFEGSWQLSSLTWSLKRYVQFEVWQKFEHPPEYRLGGGFCESYVREPGFPVTAALISGGNLDTRQQLLLLALLEQGRH